MSNNQIPTVISSLLNSAAYDHHCENIQLLETHISWVILTGPFAYKIKKSIDLKFLDFSTLEKRQHFCKEELRLNSRLAPSIYLDVVAIRGPEELATFISSGDKDSGEIIEYAIKMNQFPQDKQLDRMLDSNVLTSTHIDMIANTVAEFHQQTRVADNSDHFGEPEHISKPVMENFIQIRLHKKDTKVLGLLDGAAEPLKLLNPC